MTALIIIIFILQLVLVVWAVGITLAILDIFKAFRKTTAADSTAFTALFEAQDTYAHALNAVLKTVGAVEEEATYYKSLVDEELEKQEAASRFALETIQEARRIYNAANLKAEEEEENG